MVLTLECRESILLGAFIKRETKLSTNALKKLKYRENGILVNGVHATVRFRLSPGDVVALDISDRDGIDTKCAEGEFSGIIPKKLPLDVIYDDGSITVSDKPGNMPTHPVHGHLDDTAANALAYRALERGDSAFVFRPVTRLDRNTSGLILSACDFLSSGKLGAQMKAGKIKKTYLAILCGVPANLSGTVDAPIDRAGIGTLMRVVSETGSPAVTDYRIAAVSPDGKYSLAVLHPRTGRTHQIRVHMAHIGCPLLGDFLYGEESPVIARHALHACRLEFDHPQGGRRMVFTSPMPADMIKAYRQLFGF